MAYALIILFMILLCVWIEDAEGQSYSCQDLHDKDVPEIRK